MGELVLLVVAAAWAAVLIPPLLRSRIENRPHSSVTDFRRQLNKLQGAVPARASGSNRGMARSLAQSPLQRPVAAGRPGMQPAHVRRDGGRSHGAGSDDGRGYGSRGNTMAQPREAPPRRRTHGDPTGGQPRPQHHKQAHVARHEASADDQLRRRRSNVLFMLVLTSGATLFLAATTKEPSMLYIFAGTFLALCGYVYMLSQARQRESTAWPNDWMQH
jgi:hypothetical protein